MGWGVMPGAAQGTWGHLPPPLLSVLLFLGRLRGKGKPERALAGGVIHSHAGMRRGRSGLATSLGRESGRAGQPQARPSLVAAWPRSQRCSARAEGNREPRGSARGVGGIWGAFGPCWGFIDPGRVHVGKGKLRHSLSAGQREFQGRVPAGISWIQRDQAAKSRSRTDPGCFPGEAGRAVSVSGSWRRSLGDRSFGNARECGISPGTEGRRAGQVFGLGQRGCKLPAQPQAPCVARREPRLCPVPSAGCSGAAAAAGPGQSGALSTGLRCSRAGDGITPPPATAGHVGPGRATSLRPVAPPAPLPWFPQPPVGAGGRMRPKSRSLLLFP